MEPGFRERLLTALEAAGIAAEVVITANRVTMVSVRAKCSQRGSRQRDREVRVAEPFAALGEAAIQAVVAFAQDLPEGRARVQELIRSVPGDRAARVVLAMGGAAPLVARAGPPVRSRGLHHDLAVLAEAERQAHFPDLPVLPVCWGRRGPKRQLRTIHLGSYEPHDQVVRIHPRLDDGRVPAWFVGFVIFHEYLHHALGIRLSRRGDRRELHPPAFRLAEARHPRYAQALAWEEAHITAILSADW